MQTVNIYQWLTLIVLLLLHTGALFRWGGRVGVKLEGHDREHKEAKERISELRETDVAQGQVLAVATRLLDVHAEEIQRLRDWKHDDYQQWAQSMEARMASLELDRQTHGDKPQVPAVDRRRRQR